MNERQLQCIQAIAREGSIHKAASVLSRSPSTLARMLKQSEDFLGAAIFLRTSEGMVLTERGKETVSYVEELLDMFERLREWAAPWREAATKGHEWSEAEIRYLLAIHEEKSISRAAKRLYLAQPSLSQLVLELEADLGSPIFYRNREGVAETEFGAGLFRRLKEIDDKYSEFIGKYI